MSKKCLILHAHNDDNIIFVIMEERYRFHHYYYYYSLLHQTGHAHIHTEQLIAESLYQIQIINSKFKVI